MRSAVDQIVAETAAGAMRAELASIGDIVTGMSKLLTALTDVDNVTAYQPSEVAERLHIYRNVAVALAVAAAASIGAKSEPVLAKCTRFKTRSVQHQRGLTDDEILLARLYAAALSRCAPQSQASAIYAMVDAGMVQGETTSVTARDVDDYEQPSLVYAPRNGHLADRYLPLDRFGSAVIGGRVAKAVADGYSAGRPLTYVPRKYQPGSKRATASAQGVLDRFLAELGLGSVDTTAPSVTLWRVASVLAAQGEDAALQVSGRTTKHQMYAQLTLPAVDDSQPTADEITSFGDAA